MLELNKEYVDANGERCSVVGISYGPAALLEFKNGRKLMVCDGSVYEQAMKKVEPTVMLDMGSEVLPLKLTQQQCLDVRSEIMKIAESCDHKRLPLMMRATAMLREWYDSKFKVKS